MPNLLVHAPSGDLRLEIAAGQSVRDALDTTALRVRAACGGTGACGACAVRLVAGPANPPTLAEYQKLTAAERAAGNRLACQLRVTGDSEILVTDPAPPSAWTSIPAEELLPMAGARRELDRHPYGLAVDLGTTNIRISLWDRKCGRRIASRRGPNPQGTFGADVLNRLDQARGDPGRAAELAKLARTAIVQAVRDILARDVGEVTPMLAQIGHVMIVGNTAMLALLAGNGIAELMSPDHWQTAVNVQPEDAESFRAGWFMPNAAITLLPPLGGFVGSDLVADLAATGFACGPQPELLLDIGTNNEIALWDGSRLHVTSVPGGPAFEGLGIRHGMPAEEGAICRVAADGRGGYECAVIGGGLARGLCGSGLADAVAAMLEAGVLKPSGRFAAPPPAEGFQLIPGNGRSAVAAGDVDAFQRAKAATAAAMAVLLRETGLYWTDLSRLCVCGSFGHRLGIRQAQATGLLPPLGQKRIELVANASLAGCERALLSPQGEADFRRLANRARLLNLSFVVGYDDCYIEHLRLQPIPAAPPADERHHA